MFVGGIGFAAVFSFIDQKLKLDWVSIDFVDFLISQEGDVFKSMDLAKQPEKVVLVFADSLDSHMVPVFLHVIEALQKFIFHEWPVGVFVQVINEILLCGCDSRGVFKHAELANNVGRGHGHVLSNSSVSKPL